MRRSLLVLAIAASCTAAVAGDSEVTDTPVALDAADDARVLAESYLKAITGTGSEQAIDALLGGATLTLLDMESYRIVSRESHRHERGDLADLHAHVSGIDRAGREAFSRLGGDPEPDPDGLGIRTLTPEQAAKLQAPVKARVQSFAKGNPVFAYISRVDKTVYWNPRNPFRKLLAQAGKKGRYQADLDVFWVETVDRADSEKKPRKWPLRVVRFRANYLDTGLKILPAASWNAE